MSLGTTNDAGLHYRYHMKVPITDADIERGYTVAKLDPFRIADVYLMNDFAMKTILKKCLAAGDRGHKSIKQDLNDIICAAQRKLEMMDEEEALILAIELANMVEEK